VVDRYIVVRRQELADSDPFDSSEFPANYQTLIREQTMIGWKHLFQGRITTSWQRMQQYHYSGLRPVQGRDGASWSRSILAFIFSEWLLLWDSRNKSVHGNDSVSRSQAKHNQAIRELEILYSFRHQVLQRDRSLYYDSIELHRAKPTQSIRQWLNSYRDLLLHSLKEAKVKSLLHVRPITSYFNPA
jgi:hypothetical protein